MSARAPLPPHPPTHKTTPPHPTRTRRLTARRREMACSSDLRPYILVTACRLRTSDLAMTFTDSCITTTAILKG